jgi:hypothetical protein
VTPVRFERLWCVTRCVKHALFQHEVCLFAVFSSSEMKGLNSSPVQVRTEYIKCVEVLLFVEFGSSEDEGTRSWYSSSQDRVHTVLRNVVVAT